MKKSNESGTFANFSCFYLKYIIQENGDNAFMTPPLPKISLL